MGLPFVKVWTAISLAHRCFRIGRESHHSSDL